MPPKTDKTAKLTVIKFKRGKSTYVIPLDLSKNKKMKDFKSSLASMINESGGLSNDDDDMDQDQDLDIEVPQSELIDQETQTVNPQTITVSDKELKIATPKDKTNPYSNQWIEIDEAILDELSFNDYDILAFATQEEEFHVIEAAYEEQ